MSNSSTVLEDDSKLSVIDKKLFKFESYLNLLGGITVFVLVLLAVVNVLGRWIFNLPLSGYIDWIEQAMILFAFLGLAYCQREGSHIRMDILVRNIHGRTLWASEFASTLLMLIVSLILVYGSFLHAWRAYDIGDSSINIDLPIWPAKLVVPFALSLLSLRLFIQLWAYANAFLRKQQFPVAVPLVEEPAMQAAHQIQRLPITTTNGDKPSNHSP